MAYEPDNLVLLQLREIRATLAGHSSRFDRIEERFGKIDKRFDRIDKRFDEFHLLVGYTLSVSQTSYLKVQEFEQRHELSEGEQRRMSDRMEDVERRLSNLEENDES
ncbi:MAG TPA: hypothetical protein VGF29_12790 [Hyphomicrobiaceae bacterium]